MRIGSTHLTYCLNVHKGESLAEARAAIQTYATAVKSSVSPDDDFCLGLRLSAVAARELAPRASEFAAWLRESGFYSVTVNGFPYGPFHGTRVKEDVYQPDWSRHERLEYTRTLADIMAALVPEGDTASISTSPVAYGKSLPEGAVSNLASAAAYLDDLERRTGRRVVLALEPEPGCYLETAQECVSLWREFETAGIADSPHLGVCLDACHAAVSFHEPLDELRTLVEAGIRVAKVHLSAGLVAEGPGTREALRPYVEDTYLHQSFVREAPGHISAYPDLDVALDASATGQYRVHFHVPLDWTGHPPLRSTADSLDADFFAAAIATGAHLEVETYTFGVMPGAGDLAESIVRELRWARERCESTRR